MADSGNSTVDSGLGDAGNSGADSGPLDSGISDSGTPDSGTPDSGTTDSGTPDSGAPDSGAPDSGAPDSGTPDSGTPDSGTPDSGTPDSGMTGADAGNACYPGEGNTTCNMLTQAGTAVTAIAVPVAAPTPQGGLIPPGEYVLTGDILYTGVGGRGGATGNVLAGTLVIASDTLGASGEVVMSSGTCAVGRFNITLDASGAQLTTSQTCPACESGAACATGTEGYTWDGANLTTFQTGSDGVVALTFTLPGSNHRDGGASPDGGATIPDGGTSRPDGGVSGPDGGMAHQDGGAAGSDAGQQCSSQTGGSCNSLTAGGAIVEEIQIPTAAPSPTGGTIAAGTYNLTADIIYTGSGGTSGTDGVTGQTTLMVSKVGNSTVLQIADVNNGCPVETQTASITFSGTQFTADVTCPANCSDCGGATSYSFDGTNLTIFGNGNGAVQTHTFSPSGSCSSEGDAQFCASAAGGGTACGMVTGTDNCGTSRTVSCGNTCPANAACDDSRHACACETGFSGDGTTACSVSIGSDCSGGQTCPTGQNCIPVGGGVSVCDVVGCQSNSQCGTNGEVDNVCEHMNGGDGGLNVCVPLCDPTVASHACGSNPSLVCVQGMCNVSCTVAGFGCDEQQYGTTCDSSTGLCVPLYCGSGGSCPTGDVCDLDPQAGIGGQAVCVADCRLSNGSCPDSANGEGCNFNSGVCDGSPSQPDGGQNNCSSDNGAECSMAPVLGLAVSELQVPETAPNPTGGTIPAGTYVLTSQVVFTGAGGADGPDGQEDSQTVVISYSGTQATLQIAQVKGQCSTQWQTITATMSGGTTIAIDQTCPACPSGQTCGGTIGYSWDGANFTVYSPGNNGQITAQTFAAYSANADAGMQQADGGGQCGGVYNGGQCNGFGLTGSPVVEQNVALSPPAAIGGTVVPGMYSLQSWTNYTGTGGANGPTDQTIQETVQLTASATGFMANAALAMNGCPQESVTETTTFTGTTFSQSQICPAADGGLNTSATGSYSVNGQLLIIYLQIQQGVTSELVLGMAGMGSPDGGINNQCSSDDGSECSSLTLLGSPVPEVQVPENAPTTTGGAVPAGTYVLTSQVAFTGTNGPSGGDGNIESQTIAVSLTSTGATVQTVSDTGTCGIRWSTLNVTFSGATISSTQTCPTCDGSNGGCGGTLDYSWDGTNFTLYNTNENGQIVAQIFNVYSPGADAGMGQGDGGNQCGTPTGGSCATIAQEGSAVTPVAVALAPPAAAGGTISPGTYVLTAWVDYTGAGGSTVADESPIQETIEISSNSTGVAANAVIQNPGCSPSFQNWTLAPEGSQFSETESCPMPCSGVGGSCTMTGSYSANGSSFTVYVVTHAGTTAGLTFSLPGNFTDGGMTGNGCNSDLGTGCNSVTELGSPVTQMFSTQNPPAGTGGTLNAGTYTLTSATFYTGGSGGTGGDTILEATLVLTATAGGFTLDQVQSNGTCPEVWQSGSVTLSGSDLSFAQTCPVCTAGDNCGGSAEYSANSDGSLSIYIPQGNGATLAETFTPR